MTKKKYIKPVTEVIITEGCSMTAFTNEETRNAARDDNTKTAGPEIRGADDSDEGAKSNPWSVAEWEE
jgi:hypothetical protein